MEGRPPFDPDDDLDFDFDSPRRRQWEREHPGQEHPRSDPDEAPPEPAPPEPPSEEAPYDSDSFDSHTEQPSSTEYPAADPFDTRERRPPRRERKKRRGLRLPGRRSRRDKSARAETGDRPVLSDDPFDTGEAAAAHRARRHHRDLPAKVRRRQAAGVGLVVIVVLVGAFLLLKGGAGGGSEEKPLALKRLVGQTIIGKLPRDGPDKDLIKRVKKGQLGGVIATTPDAQTLNTQVAKLQRAAAAGGSPPLLVMVDQEGGDVKRLPDGPPNTSPPDLGDQNDADAAKQEGEDTASFLKGAGVNVDLAPVLDVRLPITADTIGSRTYSDDAAVVSSMGSAFIQGLQSGGVAATAKHFPGLGPATLNTDFAVVQIAARQEVLDAALQPFQAAVDAGVALVMVSSANYPSYGPDNPKDPNKPASQVKAIVQNLLRGQLGFQGLVITDNLQSVAIEELGSPTTAGVAALGAGCDLILYAQSSRGSEEALTAAAKAVKQNKLSRDQIQASYDRILSLKQRLSEGSG